MSISRAEHLANLRNKMNSLANPKGSYNNAAYWKPELDKAGLGSAIIRFLPAPKNEAFPFVDLYTHGFQGSSTGKWYIENCPTTIAKGTPCPCCECNTGLWKTLPAKGVALTPEQEVTKSIVGKLKRKLNYISNILVINDPKHPENNGKVFLFRYGSKIFDKIKDALEPPPEFGDMEAIDAYDPEFGANFKLRVTKQDGYPNYDKSSFDNSTAIGNEDYISKILSQLHSLEEIKEPKNFKTYQELANRFDIAFGVEDVPHNDAARRPVAYSQPQAPVAAPVPVPSVKNDSPLVPEESDAPWNGNENSDQSDDFFANLQSLVPKN